jgi:hypothetical protein
MNKSISTEGFLTHIKECFKKNTQSLENILCFATTNMITQFIISRKFNEISPVKI